MNTGERIKKIRNEKGLSTYDLSKKAGVSQSTVSKLENGKRKADTIIIEKLAEALEVSPDRLTGDSVSSIIENRLEESNITLEEVAEKSGVSLFWLQNLDDFTPGQFGDYEIGYDWITRVAAVIKLPGSKLRAALARQEIPVYNEPPLTAKDAFQQVPEDINKPFDKNRTKSPISKTELDHLYKYRSIDEKGRHTVNTVLEMEYNRCKLIKDNPVISIESKDKSYLEPQAAHERTDIEVTDEMRKHDDDLMDNDDLWNQ